MNKILTALLFLFISLNAQNAKLDNIIKDLGTILYEDNEDKTENMKDKLEALIEEDGYDATVSAYLGALTAKMAIFTWMPWSQLSYAGSGSKMLDKAVKKEPNNPEIRFNRFFAYISFPIMLKKASFIQEDARFIINLLKTAKDQEVKDNAHTALSMFFLREKDNAKYKKHYSMIKGMTFKKRVDKFKKNEDA